MPRAMALCHEKKQTKEGGENPYMAKTTHE